MSYTYFVNSDQVTLINLSNGNKTTVYRDDPRFEKFKNYIQNSDFEAAENMETKTLIRNFMQGNVKISDGVGTIRIGAQEYPLNDVIVTRIGQMVIDGFSPTPLINFLNNLYSNPSKTAIDELFLFLDACKLPITTDGCFIAYKIVNKDFKDIYTGKMDNSIGQTVTMPRFSVDDKRQNTCSSGLHFCSKEYLPHYGSSVKSEDRCVLVKINPADVVSIPSDYNNAKGRTCKYVVVGEVDDQDFRQMLADREYTAKSVVDEEGNEFDDDYYDDDSDYLDDVDTGYFSYDVQAGSWYDTFRGEYVSRADVCRDLNFTLAEVIDLETKVENEER